MALAKVGRRGSLVLPSKERRRAKIEQGDRVEVKAQREGVLIVRKVPTLKMVQERIGGRLPQWAELEGRADKLLELESKSRKA